MRPILDQLSPEPGLRLTQGSPRLISPSEEQLQSELNIASLGSRAADHAKGRAAERAARIVEVRPVEQIECLDAELDPRRSCLERLEPRQIHGGQPRAVEAVQRGVAQ